MAWLRVKGFPGVSLAVLTLLFGGYAFYVYGQLRDVETQNLRTLSKATLTLEAMIHTLDENLEHFAGNPVHACSFQRRQTRLQLEYPSKCACISGQEECDGLE